MSTQGMRSFVKAPLNEARLNRQWGSIAERLDEPKSTLRRQLMTVAAVLALVIGAGTWLHARNATSAGPWDGAVIESQDSTMTVALGDGSRIELDARTKLVLTNGNDRRTALVIQRGGASFDVTHVSGRSFEVSLGEVVVHVVGTRFSLREVAQPSGAPAVEVAVTRGAVEARANDNVVRLTAGQKWAALRAPSAHASIPKKPTRPAPEAPTAPAASEPPAGGTSPAAPDVSAAPDVAPPFDRSAPVTNPLPEPGAANEAVKASAKQLFEAANRARAAGDVVRAAQGYRTLLDKFPRDPRAPLAAFELGRLQMDRLGQPSESVGSLKRSIAASSKGSFREDAMARLVSAYAESGDKSACLKARGAYLKQYPNGVHRATVQAQCGASGSP